MNNLEKELLKAISNGKARSRRSIRKHTNSAERASIKEYIRNLRKHVQEPEQDLPEEDSEK